MSPSDLQSLLKLLKERDLSTIYSGFWKRLAERRFDCVRIVAAFDPPATLDGSGVVSLVRDPNDQDVFYSVLGHREFRISPDDPFTGIALNLVFPGLASETTVRFQFETITDDSITRTRNVVSHDYYGSWGVVPIFEDIGTQATEATVRIETSGEVDRESTTPFRQWLLDKAGSAATYYVPDRPQLGAPVVGSETTQPPIVLLSIDTLRYDQRAQLRPLLDELGETAYVPAEPRTQGYWTAPSHASMFTGVHPGVHEYLGWDEGANSPINPSLETIPSLLSENGYKCSGIVSHAPIRPQFGFGTGFHRFRYDPMTDWIDRDNDARSTVQRLIDWVRTDARRGQNLFYFAHLFDPHGPYIPPPSETDQNLDLSAVKEFRDLAVGPYRDDPTQLFNAEPDVSPDVADLVWDYYQSSVRYTAEQVARFIRELKRQDLFEDALVIVTGDHGEEWGESGYFGHSSLYDRNIRPFMAIKPPTDASWTVPDAVDTIDFLPTVAQAIGTDVPQSCQGQPLQQADHNRAIRIFEAISPEWYHLAIERDSIKTIATFEGTYPDRPSPDQVTAGPVHVECHTLEEVRDGNYDGTIISDEQRTFLEETAAEFVTSDVQIDPATSRGHVAATDQVPEERLEYLGYKR